MKLHVCKSMYAPGSIRFVTEVQLVICYRGYHVNMLGIVNVLLVIDGIIMIILILLQSGKSEGLSGAISGGAEQLFGKQKARGIDLVLHRGTIVTAVIFFVLAFLSAYVLQ